MRKEFFLRAWHLKKCLHSKTTPTRAWRRRYLSRWRNFSSIHNKGRKKEWKFPCLVAAYLYIHDYYAKSLLWLYTDGDEERKFSIYVYLICSLPHIPPHTKHIIIVYVSAVLIIEKGKQWLCSTFHAFHTAGFKAFSLSLSLTDIKAPYFIISRCKHHRREENESTFKTSTIN